MKRIVFLLVFLFLLFHPVLTYADDSWVIENFSSNLAVQQSGVVDVVETISVDFRNTPQYGIYRAIPYEYEVNGKEIYTKITVSKVLQNNVPVKYSTSENNGFEVISIGDSSTPLIGRNVYTITYTVTGILHERANSDELYWNVTGFNWPVEIEKAEAEVLLPDKGIISASCSEGTSGNTSVCQSDTESFQGALFSIVKPLAPSQGFTIGVTFEKGLVPILTANPPLTYLQTLMQWPAAAESLLIILTGIVVCWYVWYKYTGDFLAFLKSFGRKNKKSTAQRAVIKAEFSPPDNLSPAEIGVLLKMQAQAECITATIIDLGFRGFLQIVEIPKKWQFGSVDYLFIKTVPQNQNDNKTMRSYERLLHNALFNKRIQVKLSRLPTPFYHDLGNVKNALYHDVIVKKLFPFDPEKNHKRYRTLSLLLGFFSLCMLYVGTTTHSINAGEFGIGLLVDSVLFFFIYRNAPHRTPYGTRMYERSLGFMQFIEQAERYKQRYIEKETSFNEIVPFALLSGSPEQFGRKMEKFAVRSDNTKWFIGNNHNTILDFTTNIRIFSDSMSRAIGEKAGDISALHLQSKDRLEKRSKGNNKL